MRIFINTILAIREMYEKLNSKKKKIAIWGLIIFGCILFFLPGKFINFIGLLVVFSVLFLLLMFKLNIEKFEDDI